MLPIAHIQHLPASGAALSCQRSPAGAPAANKTYFCDAASTTCFALVATPSNYSAHKSYCSGTLNGALVAHSSREKQLLVGSQPGLMARGWWAARCGCGCCA